MTKKMKKKLIRIIISFILLVIAFILKLDNTIINNIEYKVVSGYFVPDNKVTPNKIVITKNMLGITCLDGIYYITEIKPAGKKVMAIKDFLNGIRINEFKNYEVK